MIDLFRVVALFVFLIIALTLLIWSAIAYPGERYEAKFWLVLIIVLIAGVLKIELED